MKELLIVILFSMLLNKRVQYDKFQRISSLDFSLYCYFLEWTMNKIEELLVTAFIVERKKKEPMKTLTFFIVTYAITLTIALGVLILLGV